MTSVGLLRAGLEALERLDRAQAGYRLPLGLLGQGFERLMKLAIALVELESAASLPTLADIKAYRHDLLRLLDRCTLIAEGPSSGGDAALADARFLATDHELRLFIAAMAAYCGVERYADLGRFLGDPKAQRQDPRARMDELETTILQRHPEWASQLGQPTFDAGFNDVLLVELTSITLRLGRALSRLFAWGPGGDLGREMGSMLLPLLTLRDDQLGEIPREWRP